MAPPPLCSGQPYEFVPLDWLKKWLDDSTATKEIDNAHFLCPHGKMHPDKVGDSKRVSQQAATLLYQRYGGGPRLDGEGPTAACYCYMLHANQWEESTHCPPLTLAQRPGTS